mmetsp:Transcript_29285/g.68997  ORF Transcript_29285/g.68997 Transcript_29285/m.68997 type:complete len:275 (-) Transcript_29285:42-866(-)
MNSLMSSRTMLSSSSKSAAASALASSVLPTPVGPRKRKEASGRLGSARPALERMMASATASTAVAWPLTRDARRAGSSSSFSASARSMRSEGMPVHCESTAATSLAATRERSRGGPSSAPPLPSLAAWLSASASASACSSSALSEGSLPYLSSAARSSSYSFSACSTSMLTRSISSLMLLSRVSLPFSASQRRFRSACRASSVAASPSSLASCARARGSSSASVCSEICSICTCSSRRDTSSSSCGREVASILSLAAASSMRSMALSGRKRSVM